MENWKLPCLKEQLCKRHMLFQNKFAYV
jgi:hypothetical protein